MVSNVSAQESLHFVHIFFLQKNKESINDDDDDFF